MTHFFNLSLGDAHGVLGGAVGQVLDDTIRQRQEAQLYRYLNDMEDANVPYADALVRVAAEEPGRPFLKASELTELKDQVHRFAANLPPAEPLAAKLREHPPAVQAVEEPGVKLDVALETINDYVHRLPPVKGEARHGLEPLADFAATYPVHFPPQPYAEMQTEQGHLVAHWESDSTQPFHFAASPRVDVPPPDRPDPPDSSGLGGGGGGGGRGGGPSVAPRASAPPRPPKGSGSGGRMIPTPTPPPSPVLAARSVSRAGMARSFVRLRGFARIGGVLIGATPGSSSPAPQPPSGPGASNASAGNWMRTACA